MKAFNDASVVDDDVIRFGRPSDGSLTWSGVDAVCDSMGSAGTASNKSKRVVWMVSAGCDVTLTTVTDSSYLPGQYGTAQDTEGPDSHAVRGHMFRFINPKQGMTFYFNTEANSSFNITQTGTVPTEVGGGYSSAFYFVNKGAQAGTSGRVFMYGLQISRYDGNGVMYLNVPPGYLDNFDISHTMTGIRYEGASCNGLGQTTLLNGAVSAGATTLTVDSTSGFTTGDLIRIGTGALYRDTEFRLVTVTNGTTLTLQPGPSARPGLHYGHADNVQVGIVYGARFGRTHHNDVYGLDSAGFGGEGVSFNKLPHDVVCFRVQSDTNYGQYEMGSFGVDGGAWTPYAQGDDCAVTECLTFDNHSLLESGTDSAGLPNDGQRFIYTFNKQYGKIDQQATQPSSDTGGVATAAIFHLRCVEGWLVRRNTSVATNGHASTGGARWTRTGSSTYEGDIDNFYMCENIFYFLGHDTSWMDHSGDFAFPVSSNIDRNIWYRTAGSDPGGAHHNGSTTYAANGTGKGQYTTATGFDANSLWGTDPGLWNPSTGDLRLIESSVARGMAANGDDIGALDYVEEEDPPDDDPITRPASPSRTTSSRSASGSRTASPSRTASQF
jgi:hypothetical protein